MPAAAAAGAAHPAEGVPCRRCGHLHRQTERSSLQQPRATVRPPPTLLHPPHPPHWAEARRQQEQPICIPAQQPMLSSTAGEPPLHTLLNEKQYLIRTEPEEHTIKHFVTITLAQFKPQFNKEPLKKASIEPNLKQRSCTLHHYSSQGTRSRLEHGQHQHCTWEGTRGRPQQSLAPTGKGIAAPAALGPTQVGSHDQRPTDRQAPGQLQPSSGGLSFPQGFRGRNREAEPRHEGTAGQTGRPPPLPGQI